jgi:GT2 family glycosyltransferase
MSSSDLAESAEAAPVVTISLVTFNGLRWLPGCIASLCSQQLTDFELLIIDNASTDGSANWLRQLAGQDDRTVLTESHMNLGFAKAHNRHLLVARGDFVLLLNQDVELDPGFLGHAVSAFDGRPTIAAVQPRLRRLAAPGERTDVLDSTGLVMHRDRRVVSRRQGHREGPADLIAGPVWGADGPAPIYRRDALLDARLPSSNGGSEVLDEDFFMYKEDVDLAWRLRLLGWQSWYQPGALAWHGRTGGPGRTLLEIARTSQSIPAWIKDISWRNQRLMQIKNEPVDELVRDLPWIAAREALSLAFLAIADRRRLRSVGGLLVHLAGAFRKRRGLMRERARRVGETRRLASHDRSFWPRR